MKLKIEIDYNGSSSHSDVEEEIEMIVHRGMLRFLEETNEGELPINISLCDFCGKTVGSLHYIA